jgi:hypothetical protein
MRASVWAARTGGRKGDPGALGAGERTPVPREPGVECEPALGQLPGKHLLERGPRCRSRTADAVDYDAQPLRWDAELKERVELREARP